MEEVGTDTTQHLSHHVSQEVVTIDRTLAVMVLVLFIAKVPYNSMYNFYQVEKRPYRSLVCHLVTKLYTLSHPLKDIP